MAKGTKRRRHTMYVTVVFDKPVTRRVAEQIMSIAYNDDVQYLYTPHLDKPPGQVTICSFKRLPREAKPESGVE